MESESFPESFITCKRHIECLFFHSSDGSSKRNQEHEIKLTLRPLSTGQIRNKLSNVFSFVCLFLFSQHAGLG